MEGAAIAWPRHLMCTPQHGSGLPHLKEATWVTTPAVTFRLNVENPDVEAVSLGYDTAKYCGDSARIENVREPDPRQRKGAKHSSQTHF